MTDWCQIAIELYRDGMTKAEIRRKLEITERQLERWLLDEPVPDDVPGRKKASQARKVAVKMLRAGMKPKEVWKELQAQGLKATLSSVQTWRKIVNGPINKRIEPEVIADIFRAYPDVKPALAAQLYAIRTGEAPSRQAVDYWINKLRAAA